MNTRLLKSNFPPRQMCLHSIISHSDALDKAKPLVIWSRLPGAFHPTIYFFFLWKKRRMSKIRSAQNVASSYISTRKVFPFTAICCGKVVRDPLPIAVHVFINKSHISLHAAFIATSLSLVLFGLCRLFLPSLTHSLAFLFSHFFLVSLPRQCLLFIPVIEIISNSKMFEWPLEAN